MWISPVTSRNQSLWSSAIRGISRVHIKVSVISRALNLNTLTEKQKQRRDLLLSLTDLGYTPTQIASKLNANKVPKDNGTKWTRFDTGVSVGKWKRRRERETDTQVYLSDIAVRED